MEPGERLGRGGAVTVGVRWRAVDVGKEGDGVVTDLEKGRAVNGGDRCDYFLDPSRESRQKPVLPRHSRDIDRPPLHPHDVGSAIGIDAEDVVCVAAGEPLSWDQLGEAVPLQNCGGQVFREPRYTRFTDGHD